MTIKTRKVWVVMMNEKLQTSWIYGDRGRASDLACYLAIKNPKFTFRVVRAELRYPVKGKGKKG